MPCWMLVDHGELGAALLGLLQQALRLVEEARVLQRHAHARGDGADEQTHVGFAERVVALVFLQGDEAETPVAGEDRHDTPDRRMSVPAATNTPSAAYSSRFRHSTVWRD